MIYDVIIIGSGPAAHTAAIYTSRSTLKTLMLEGMVAGGVVAGGQLTTTNEIENFPGFPTGISGIELMNNMRAQSINYGTDIKTETVTSVNLQVNANHNDAKIKQVFTENNNTYQAYAIIIATGATANRLDIPGVEDLWQKGISACAVCDGGLPIFRNQELGIIGGGDTACEEALFLTHFASKVHIFVRRNIFRASRIMQERIQNHSKITIHWQHEVRHVHGTQKIESLTVEHTPTKKEFVMPIGGLFFAVGHTPNTAFLNNQLSLDKNKYIIVHNNVCTTVSGVFAAGDVCDHEYRQAITAAGAGCMAALQAERFIYTVHN